MTKSTEIALSPDQRAQSILRFDERKVELTALAAKSTDLVEITNVAGYQQLHAARMVLKNERIAIEKAGKEARDDATKFSKAVIAAENELVGIIQPEETRLADIQKAWDDKVAEEKAAQARAEADRVARIRARITALAHLPVALVGGTVEDIDAAIAKAQAFDGSDLAGADQIDAEDAKVQALEKLGVMRDQRVAADEEAKRVAAERAELEESRRKLAALEAEAASRRAEQDRIAEEERKRAAEAEQDRLREAREVEERRAAQERAERQRAQEAEDAERRKRQAEEDEQRRAEETRLAEARAEIVRQRQAEEAKARAREIANATLKGTAAEARTRLIELGEGDTLLVAKLTSVLHIESEQAA